MHFLHTKPDIQPRIHNEEGQIADNFSEDRRRVISSSAFRRMESKTQVFVSSYGDHYRNRLTHSLEVAEIAKSICSQLGLNKDLAEVVSLAHDIGHPCFGHDGEDVLKKIMKNYNADYNHNTSSFKILTKLENRCNDYEGLNLTTTILDGILKHNGPLKDVPEYIKEYNKSLPKDKKFNFTTFPTLEAQIANLADDIAYVHHDVEDAFRADIITIEDIEKLPIFSDIVKSARGKYSFMEYALMLKEIKYTCIDLVVSDVVENTTKNLSSISNIEQVYNNNDFIANFSPEMLLNIKNIKKFMYENVYYSKKIQKHRKKIEPVITKLFDTFIKKPELMDAKWLDKYNICNTERDKAVLLCDYISGMTDIYASAQAKKFLMKIV